VVGTIASLAPVLGPVIGGWITDTWNWHWLFYVNLVPGIFVTILAVLLIRIDEPDLSLLKGADYPGIVLMAVALSTLEYVLEEGSRWNWLDDATIRNCARIAAIAGVLFVIRSLTFARPVVDLRALTNRNFAVGCFLSFVTGIGIFSTIYLTPLFLGYVRGYSAWQTGIAIFSTGAASLAGVPVYILLARKFDTRWLMMLGLALFGLSMWAYSYITSDWSGGELLVPQLLRGFPQVFAVAPAVTLGLGSLSPERLKYASGLFNMMRNLGGAVGIAVCGAILNAQTNFHFNMIASHLTPANGPMMRVDCRGRGALRRDPGQPGRRSSRRFENPLAACLPRSLDAGLCRRVPRDHARLHRRHIAGSAIAPGCAHKGARRKRPLKFPRGRSSGRCGLVGHRAQVGLGAGDGPPALHPVHQRAEMRRHLLTQPRLRRQCHAHVAITRLAPLGDRAARELRIAVRDLVVARVIDDVHDVEPARGQQWVVRHRGHVRDPGRF